MGNLIHTQVQTLGVQVARWHEIPKVWGIGETIAEAISDLYSREHSRRQIGDVHLSTLGSHCLARVDNDLRVGIGRSPALAIKDLVCHDDRRNMTHANMSDGSWVWTIEGIEGRAARIFDAYAAAARAFDSEFEGIPEWVTIFKEQDGRWGSKILGDRGGTWYGSTPQKAFQLARKAFIDDMLQHVATLMPKTTVSIDRWMKFEELVNKEFK